MHLQITAISEGPRQESASGIASYLLMTRKDLFWASASFMRQQIKQHPSPHLTPQWTVLWTPSFSMVLHKTSARALRWWAVCVFSARGTSGMPMLQQSRWVVNEFSMTRAFGNKRQAVHCRQGIRRLKMHRTHRKVRHERCFSCQSVCSTCTSQVAADRGPTDVCAATRLQAVQGCFCVV